MMLNNELSLFEDKENSSLSSFQIMKFDKIMIYALIPKLTVYLFISILYYLLSVFA